MYNYSPIHKIYIKNFRNLGEVEIDFSQSPIVTLVGENEAGKTSVIKAFATCALHANPRDQKDYIRDGTKMFGVAIDLQDGTRIVRMKEATGINSYQVLRPDGKNWSTNKITDGLPVEIQNIMGLIEEPETKEFLHIRTYEDKLLFVVTPNSTNYKVMYNALKVEQLTKAIKNGSTEVNQLKSKISTNEISINTLGNQLKDVFIIDTEPLLNIKQRLTEQLSLLDKLERARNLANKVDNCERQLGALGLLDRFNLQPISEIKASKLATISRLLNNRDKLKNERNRISELDNIETIDLGVVNKIENIINKKEMLDRKIADAGALVQLTEISEISEMKAMHIVRAGALLDRLNALRQQYNYSDLDKCKEIQQHELDKLVKMQKIINMNSNIKTNKDQYNQIVAYCEQVQNWMKSIGVAFETCPKCGESVLIDMDKVG